VRHGGCARRPDDPVRSGAIGGIAPDVVILAVVLFSLRARAETAMLAAFSIGFLFDAVASSSALGLRAIAYTTVAFVAVKTRDRADLGPSPWPSGLD
jgi:rod shape-determining protein MreD